MKINLVTTPILDSFSSKSENLIVGKWCLQELKNTKKNLIISESPYHWASEDKVKKDYKYLKKFYYQTISNISSLLNDYHNVDKPERYWHIILGPFLVNFIPLIWDRWETIRNLSNIKFKTIIFKSRNGPSVFEDVQDFIMSINDNYWNHSVYVEIIKLLKKQNCIFEEKEFDKYKRNPSFWNPYLKKIDKKNNNFLKSNLSNLIDPFFKNNKYLFYDVAFNKINFIKLNLTLGQIPTINSKFDRKIFKNNTINRDKLKIGTESNDQFENYCNYAIIKNLPKTYLENYKNIKNFTDKIDLNPEKIITSYAHINNDIFKIWTSEQVLKGKKFIITDHGGYIDESSHFNSMEKYSDVFFKWNKTEIPSTKQVPPNLFLNKRKILNSFQLGKKLLFLTHNCNLYPFRIGPSPISALMVDVQNSWISFLKKIQKDKKFNLKIRTQPVDSWNFKGLVLSNFNKNILSKEKKLSSEIKNSKIIINTTPQTALIECMKSGVPTILITNGYTVDVPHSINQILEKLKNNKIFFDCFDEAFDHINEIYNDPLLWWNSAKIQKIREEFAFCCSLETKNNLNFWSESLKEV